jgi:hypothetical protein
LLRTLPLLRNALIETGARLLHRARRGRLLGLLWLLLRHLLRHGLRDLLRHGLWGLLRRGLRHLLGAASGRRCGAPGRLRYSLPPIIVLRSFGPLPILHGLRRTRGLLRCTRRRR